MERARLFGLVERCVELHHEAHALAGDAAAGARFATLHRVSVIINMVQLLALVVLLFKY